MNAKQRMNEKIVKHGLKLQRIFKNTPYEGPVSLCKQLRRIENRAQRANEALCNGVITIEEHENQEKRIFEQVQLVLGNDTIPVFINSDPRGCALKIKDTYMRNHLELDLPRDWGEYGLIAPDLRE